MRPGGLDSPRLGLAVARAAAAWASRGLPFGALAAILSVRTVESHLQRVYEKLGISGRHELAAALRDQPAAAPGAGH